MGSPVCDTTLSHVMGPPAVLHVPWGSFMSLSPGPPPPSRPDAQYHPTIPQLHELYLLGRLCGDPWSWEK